MGLVMAEYIDRLVAGIIALVVTGISWLIRRVITNGKEIDLLKSEIQARERRRDEHHIYLQDMRKDIEKSRQEDRQVVENLGNDIREIRQDIKEIFKNRT
jgi:predicted  nucleic acid-binding Zn-ribbon protein